ncbi:MAG TPA: ABC transporter ATP-binding protein [Allosphingosinicella sp.]|nr:ABC transporter ATP-binding protein [Allosphingosinicella sp.]
MTDAPSRVGPSRTGREEGLAAPLLRFAADIFAFAGRGWPKILFLLVAGSLVEGFGILLLVPLLGIVIGEAPAGSWLGRFTASVLALSPSASRFGRISFLLGLFALLFAVRAWLILTRDTAMARLQIDFIQDQRLRLVRLLARSRWDRLVRLRHGRVTHVLGSDLDQCASAVYLLLQATVALAILAGQLILAFLLSPALAGLIFVLLGIGALTLRPIVRRSRDLGEWVLASNMGLVVTTTQFLGGLKLAVSQNLQKSFVAEFEAALKRGRERRVQFTRQRTGAQLALTGVAAGVAGLTVLLGIGVLGLAPAAAIAFLFILGRMNGPATQLQTGAQHVFHALPAYGELKALQAELTAADGSEAAAPLGSGQDLPKGALALENLSFSHAAGGAEAAGLNGVTLTIEPGEFVGLTGPSGAGKTTLLDLIVGLYSPAAGRITLAGAPLEGALLDLWRERVSYVSQDPFLFHDSVRRNLLWARPDADDEALREALRRAGAEDLVARLDGGLDAIVGERGTLLSGGERQRIALARAFIRRPRLLLLDEATSAIDVAGERVVLETLARDPDRPAIIIVSHRAESLALCDRLLELSGGRIVQSLGAGRFS